MFKSTPFGKAGFLYVIPLLLLILSYFPLAISIRGAKFHEQWAEIKSGINNIADNSLDIHDRYGNDEYAMSNLAVDIVHLFGVGGMFIAQYSPDLVMVSNPSYNNFTTFNPLSYTAIKKALSDREKKDRGEIQVHYVTPDGQVRQVYTYFRWVYHVHDATGSECDYLIVVASSMASLNTTFEPSVIIVFMVSLIVIVVSILTVSFVCYSVEMQKIKDAGKGVNDGSI